MYPILVQHFLEQSALRFPEKKALFDRGTWYTFPEINRRANQLARLLLTTGVKRGERVAILLQNSVEYVITYYAILKAGAVTVDLNDELLCENIAFILKDCGVKILISNLKMLSRNQCLLPSRRIESLFIWAPKGSIRMDIPNTAVYALPEEMRSQGEDNLSGTTIDMDMASILYTSGSTGKPRGVVLSHLNILTNTRSIVDYLDLSAEDRVMVVLPFYYVYGKSLLNTHFFVGGSVVIDNRFMYPNVVLKTMQEQETTGFSGVPSTFTILLNRSNVRKLKFPALRYVTQAGGAMAPAVQKEVAKVFAPAKLFIMYGATEASARLSYLDPAELPRKWGSIGKAIPNVELFVADSRGNPLPPGQQGELVARGANIMKGYWNDPDETAKVIREGLYFTRDLGVMDEEGYLYVIGRSQEMIKVGGKRVSAKEIEDAIYEFPSVEETAVIAVRDDILGEVPKAYVVVKGNPPAEQITRELLAFLNTKLATYKLPKYFEYPDALPRSGSGKIQKFKLNQ